MKGKGSKSKYAVTDQPPERLLTKGEEGVMRRFAVEYPHVPIRKIAKLWELSEATVKALLAGTRSE